MDARVWGDGAGTAWQLAPLARECDDGPRDDSMARDFVQFWLRRSAVGVMRPVLRRVGGTTCRSGAARCSGRSERRTLPAGKSDEIRDAFERLWRLKYPRLVEPRDKCLAPAEAWGEILAFAREHGLDTSFPRFLRRWTAAERRGPWWTIDSRAGLLSAYCLRTHAHDALGGCGRCGAGSRLPDSVPVRTVGRVPSGRGGRLLSNQFVVPSAEADDLLKSVRGLRLLRCVDEDDSDRCVGYSIVRAHRVLAPWCPTRYLERGPGCEGCGSAQWRQAHGPLIAAYDARYLDVPDDIVESSELLERGDLPHAGKPGGWAAPILIVRREALDLIRSRAPRLVGNPVEIVGG